jgi:hypothetical protein
MSIDLQALVDGMSAQWQRERAETQMTLGKMIEKLEAMPPEKEISGLGYLNSYRGYYSDLAFEPTDSSETVKELLERCKAAMGQVYTGYKGGDYVMGALTPIWVADYGCCGDKLMAIRDDGTLETAHDA